MDPRAKKIAIVVAAWIGLMAIIPDAGGGMLLLILRLLIVFWIGYRAGWLIARVASGEL